MSGNATPRWHWLLSHRWCNTVALPACACSCALRSPLYAPPKCSTPWDLVVLCVNVFAHAVYLFSEDSAFSGRRSSTVASFLWPITMRRCVWKALLLLRRRLRRRRRNPASRHSWRPPPAPVALNAATQRCCGSRGSGVWRLRGSPCGRRLRPRLQGPGRWLWQAERHDREASTPATQEAVDAGALQRCVWPCATQRRPQVGPWLEPRGEMLLPASL